MRKFQHFLISIIIIISSVILVCSTNDHYLQTGVSNDNKIRFLLTFPQFWRPGKNFDFHLVLFEHPSLRLPVSFEATIDLTESKRQHQKFTQTNYGLQKHTINAVKNFFAGQNVQPKVTVTFDSDTCPGCNDFVESKSIPVFSERFLIVQLDKTVYKPNENVKIMVMGLDRQLRALAGEVDVKVEDSLQRIVKFWRQQPLHRGFVVVNFTLSDFVREGEWRVGVVDRLNANSSDVTFKTFQVKRKFTPPKFKISAYSATSYWLMSDDVSNYIGYVRATDMFGVPVRGKVTITSEGSCQKSPETTSSSSVYAQEEIKFSNKFDLSGDSWSDGVLRFYGSALLKYQDLMILAVFPSIEECRFELKVDFIEEVTGEAASGEGHIQLFKSPYFIKADELNRHSIKTGLPYSATFQVMIRNGTTTGAPATNTNLYVRASFFTDDKDHCNDQPVEGNMSAWSASGHVKMMVGVPNNTRSVTFSASLPNHPGVTFCKSLWSPIRSEGSNSISISVIPSTTIKSFKVGDDIVNVKIGTTRQIGYDDAHFIAGEKVKFSILTTSQTGYVYFMLAQNGRMLEYRKLELPISDKSNPVGVTEFQHESALTAETVPQVSVLVWTLDSKSEMVITDVIELSVENPVKHTLSVSIEPEEVGPGENVAVRIRSSDAAGSMVALFAVDKRYSSSFLKSENEISLREILSKLSITPPAMKTKRLSDELDIFQGCFGECYSLPDDADSDKQHSMHIFETAFLSAFSNSLPNYAATTPVFSYDSHWIRHRKRDVTPNSHTKSNLTGKDGPTPVVNFHETWLWQLVEISPNQNEAVVEFRVPDLSTTWQLSAMTIGKSQGFGMVENAVGLKVVRNNDDTGKKTLIDPLLDGAQFSKRSLPLRLDDSDPGGNFTFIVDKMIGKGVIGSERFEVQAIGVDIGPIISDAENNIRLSNNHNDEFAVLKMAHNVYIWKYLKETGQLTSIIESRALFIVNQDLTQEFAKQQEDGGFSDSHQSGSHSSTVLTALIIRNLNVAVKMMNISVDPVAIDKAWGYVKRQATNEGLFKEPGNGPFNYPFSAYGNNDNVNLAAYFYAAFAEAGAPSKFAWKSLATTRSLFASKAMDPENIDGNQMALAAYALSILPEDRPLSKKILDRLLSMAIKNEDGSIYWQEPPYLGTAGYILMTIMAIDPDNLMEEAIAVARYLNSDREVFHSARTTQGIVVAADALSKFSLLFVTSTSARIEATVRAKFNFDDKHGPVLATFSINSDNANVLQTFEPDRRRQRLKSVEVSCSGSGAILVQLVVRYNDYATR